MNSDDLVTVRSLSSGETLWWCKATVAGFLIGGARVAGSVIAAWVVWEGVLVLRKSWSEYRERSGVKS